MSLVNDTPRYGVPAAAAGGSPDGLVGTRLGRYRLVRRIGEGGMGVVYLGQPVPSQVRTGEDRPVAIKVLRPHVAGDPDARRRLTREVETLRMVRHPLVAGVIDADVDGPLPYLVTEYVRGSSLDAQIKEHGPLTRPALARLARGLGDALAAVHGAGIVHRDLKPANVLLREGDPVVIDFGIAHIADDARLTMTGLVMGTPGYLSPELIDGAQVDRATDWWGWAATVAFAATGRPPFGRGRMEVVLDRVHRGEADLAGVPRELHAVLSSALSPDPDRRPRPGELRAAIMAFEQTCGEAAATQALRVEATQVTGWPAGEQSASSAQERATATRVVTGRWNRWRRGGDTVAEPVVTASPIPATEAMASGVSATRVLPATPTPAPVATPTPSPVQTPSSGQTSSPGQTPASGRAAVPGPAVAFGGAAPAQPTPSPDRSRGWFGRRTDAAAARRAPAGGAPGAGHGQPASPQVEQYRAPEQPMRFAGLSGPSPQQTYRQPAPAPAEVAQVQPSRWGGRQPVSAHQPPAVPQPAPPQPQVPRSRRTGTVFAGVALLALGFATAPVLASLGLAIWVSLARTVDKVSWSLLARRHARGRRRGDLVVAVAQSPLRWLLAAVVTVFWLLLPLLLAVCVYFIVEVWFPGNDFRASSALPMVAAGATLGITSWWGLGGGSVRRGTRSIIRTLTPGSVGAVFAIALLGILIAAVLAALWHASWVTNWYPLSTDPLEHLVGSAPRDLLRNLPGQ